LFDKLRVALLAVASVASGALAPRPAQAIPIFAQRYGFQCGVCHSVLPELNAFGNAFRNNGYRLPGLPKHGTTILALREQIGYTNPPEPGSERTVPAGAILGAAEIGDVEAFFHESLGSEGGPSSLFLGYLAYKDQPSKILFRLGLFELPLVHSPAQRNDTLTTYGYEGTRFGLDDLTLATPRWGLEMERPVGVATLATTIAFGNAAGSAYGGKPVATGTSQTFAAPEYGLYFRVPVVTNDVRVGLDLLDGDAAIAQLAKPTFDDAYTREGISVDARHGRLELLAEQWYGHDVNADGAGDPLASTGGFARLRWALGDHAYVGIREDASAAPAATRTLLWYAEAQVGRHARVLIQQQRPIPGGPTNLGGALTFGFPWPWGK